MALPESQRDREYRNFVDIGGQPHRLVTGTLTVGDSGTILAGVTFDEILGSYPSATVEVYTYRLSAVVQATITVTYTDSTKSFITSVVKT